MLVDIIYFAGKLHRLAHLLFIAWLLVFTWLILKIPFFRNSGLNRKEIVAIYWAKILSGIIYGLVGIYYKINNGGIQQDTWRYHAESVAESKAFLSNPSLFFSDFRNNYPIGYGGFLSSHNSWWNDIHDTLFIKFLSILNIFSGNNYYINEIFFCFLILFGSVALFRMFIDVFPRRKVVVVIGVFFIPSVLYWSSGIHKDGLIALGMSMVITAFYFGLKNGWNSGKTIAIISGFLILLLIRNYLFVLLFPALCIWYVSVKYPQKTKILFAGSYLLFGILFFLMPYLSPHLNFPAIIVNKQQDFLVLIGQSSIKVDRLEPGFLSFLHNLPQAVNIAVLQPLPNRIHTFFIVPAIIETMLWIALFVVFLFFHRRIPLNPFLVFCLFFSVSVLICIGYTVNIIGAVVRYRSAVLPFLIVPMLALTDWKWMNRKYI